VKFSIKVRDTLYAQRNQLIAHIARSRLTYAFLQILYEISSTDG